jgi:hypothetical protein
MNESTNTNAFKVLPSIQWMGVISVLIVSVSTPVPTYADEPQVKNSVWNRVTALKHDWLGAIGSLPIFDTGELHARHTNSGSQDGFYLSRPFGNRGPEIRLSSSRPRDTSNCLKSAAGIGGALESVDMVEAYVILQHRW